MPKRRGFTLTELIIVIAILLLLTVIAVGVYRSNSGSDKMRSGARTAQSAFLGARDRALHAKARRGLRLLRDPQDANTIYGFAYLQPIENLQYADLSIQLERPDWNTDGDVADAGEDQVVIVRGFDPPDALPHTDWHRMTDFFSTPPKIRIPAGTGQWYTFFWETSGPYALNQANQYLVLTTAFVDPGVPGPIAHARTSAYASCDIELAPELLPAHAPISLPSGIVIDLPNSSPNVAANWPATPTPVNIDIMFSPRGMVQGPLAALGPIHFLLRDVQDVTEGINPADVAAGVQHRELMVLTIHPQTGHVQTYPADQTDARINATGANGQDQIADDLFHFAKIGSKAGN